MSLPASLYLEIWDILTDSRRKVDWRLIPVLGILYSIAGLDRVNLSNARVAGMNADLHFDVGNRYSISLLVFFITYFLFEIPTTLSLRWIGPRLFLNVLVLSWGGVMLGMGFAQDWRVIVVCRMLIGKEMESFRYIYIINAPSRSI